MEISKTTQGINDYRNGCERDGKLIFQVMDKELKAIVWLRALLGL